MNNNRPGPLHVCVVLMVLFLALPPAHTMAVPMSGAPNRNVVVFLQGVCSSTGDGIGTDDALFSPLRAELMGSYGYSASQFLEYSYAGGSMQQVNGTWVWHHNSYAQMTPISQNYQTTSWSRLDQMLSDYHAHYPDVRFILVGHSLGGVVAFEELIKQQGMYSSLAKAVTIDSPLDGIPANVVAASVGGSLVNAVPRCAIQGPAATLLAATHNLQSNKAALQQAVRSAIEHGIQVVTAGNADDCLLEPHACGGPAIGDINSQWIFGAGAKVIQFNIPKPCTAFTGECVSGTHSIALMDSGAVATIAEAMSSTVPLLHSLRIPGFSESAAVVDPAIQRALLFGMEGSSQVLRLYDLRRGESLERIPVAQSPGVTGPAFGVLDSSRHHGYVLFSVYDSSRREFDTHIYDCDLISGRQVFNHVVPNAQVWKPIVVDQSGRILSFVDFSFPDSSHKGGGTSLVIMPIDSVSKPISRVTVVGAGAVADVALDDIGNRIVVVTSAISNTNPGYQSLRFAGYPLTGGPLAWRFDAQFENGTSPSFYFDQRAGVMYAATTDDAFILHAANGQHMQLDYRSRQLFIDQMYSTPDMGVYLQWDNGRGFGFDRLLAGPPYQMTIVRISTQKQQRMVAAIPDFSKVLRYLIAFRRTPTALLGYYVSLIHAPPAPGDVLTTRSMLDVFDWSHARVVAQVPVDIGGDILSVDADQEVIVLTLGSGQFNSTANRYPDTAFLIINLLPAG